MKSILIIEDEPAYAALLRDRLAQRHAVLVASNGLRGLELAQKTQPDLILLGLLLPDMDGMTWLGKLRRSSYGKRADVIILAEFEANEKIIRQAITNLPAYYWVKSNSKFSELLERIEKMLASAKSITA